MDVTDSTFETAVLERSTQVPVVVDLWAEWCGPCKTLGPIIEKVVAETDGKVELAKVDVDANPGVAQAFRVQSIPAVYVLKDKQVVDGFVGALPEAQVREFINRLAPGKSEVDLLVEQGDEASLQQALSIEPDHPGAVVAMADLLVDRGEREEALALLARIPESAETRRVAALARLGSEAALASGDGQLEDRLNALLDRVKGDEEARQEFLDLLETMGPDDPRTAQYRRALTNRLF